MGRRGASVGMMRRGFPSHDGAGAFPTAQSILGSTLLAEWDGRLGLGANTWTDQVGARVLTGVGAPAFGADGAFFNSRAVWKFLAASSQLMDTGAAGPTLYAIGSKPYVSFVARASLLVDTGANQLFVNCHDNANTDIQMQWRRPSGASPGTWAAFEVGADAITPRVADAAVHLFELYLDAAGQRWAAIDGVDISDAPATGIVTTVIIQRMSIGAFTGVVQPANVNIARVRACSVVPSASQRAQLRQLDRGIWGAP